VRWGNRSGCGLSGRATRPRERRASRQAGSASGGGEQDQLGSWRVSGRRAQGQPAGWQREQKGSRRAAARAVRSSGRPAGRRRCRGPQHVAAAVATCCSRSVTRAERELELRWSRPGRAGLKMPNTCGRKLAMTSDSETGGYRVLQRRESRAENLSYQREQDAGIANAAISSSTKGRNKGGRRSAVKGGIQTPRFMSDGSTCVRPLVRRSRRGACRDPIISEH
jgi:hypothetical protein